MARAEQGDEVADRQVFLTQANASYQQMQAKLVSINGEAQQYKSAIQAAEYHADAIDKIIGAMYQKISPQTFPFAIVATGGYGRSRLAPFSDIDLLFVHDAQCDIKHVQSLAERCLYVLWDLHLPLGYKIGTAEQILDDAVRDIISATSLIDMRFITGNPAIYQMFLQETVKRMAKKLPRQEFIKQKIAETDARHIKQGSTRYMLEPNIKEGRGALRDLDLLHWICAYNPEQGMMNDKHALQNILGDRLYYDYQLLQNFLWNVRYLLHQISGRKDEVLMLDNQPEIAIKLGYRAADQNIGKHVERFMRHYFLNVRKVGFLARTVIADIELSNNRKIFALPVNRLSYKKSLQGFHKEGNYINFIDADTLRQQPLNLLKIFQVMAQYKLRLHPEAIALLMSHRYLLTPYRDDAQANQLFIEIMTSGSSGVLALKLMNDMGVLAIFVPDFRNIIAQMQFNRYHYYTTDTHIFNALNILAHIEKGKSHQDLPMISSLLRGSGYRQKLLYCALFLHDIGKGRKEDHSIVGEEIAYKLCPRFGFDKEETQMIAWLVRHHLVMSDIAFKRDLLEKQTIIDFAKFVDNQEKLQLLFILTVIDIKAVSPVSWNGHKHSLLHELYSRTDDMLKHKGGFAYYSSEADDALHQQFSDAFTAWGQAEYYVKNLPSNYLSAYKTDEIIRHGKVIADWEMAGKNKTIQPHFHLQTYQAEEQNQADTHHLHVEFISKWSAQCFTDATAIMALAGGNVIQANLFRLNQHYALIYFVAEFADIVRAKRNLKDFADAIFSEDKEVYQQHIHTLNQKMAKPAMQVSTVPGNSLMEMGKVKFLSNASDLYTLIELNGRDRPGLLYQIAHALSEENIQINAAKIATFGEEVTDVFYVKDAFGMKVEQKKRCDMLTKKLQNILQKYA